MLGNDNIGKKHIEKPDRKFILDTYIKLIILIQSCTMIINFLKHEPFGL